jgi:putative membrane protein
MAQYLGTLGPFVAWFSLSLLMAGAFCLIYWKLTPLDEFKLIREGNTSAAVMLFGALVGYALPLASVMVHGANLVDFAIWGAIAAAVQLLVYFAMHLVMRDLTRHIVEDRVSVAIMVASVSLAVGILNAAAQSS